MSELGEEIEQSGKDMESRAVDVLALNKENYDELRNLKKQLKKHKQFADKATTKATQTAQNFKMTLASDQAKAVDTANKLASQASNSVLKELGSITKDAESEKKSLKKEMDVKLKDYKKAVQQLADGILTTGQKSFKEVTSFFAGRPLYLTA